jgi:hypothetical protein
MIDPERISGCEYLHWYAMILHSDHFFLYRTGSPFNLITSLMSTLHRLITDYEPNKRRGRGTMALAVFLSLTLNQWIEYLNRNAQFLCFFML